MTDNKEYTAEELCRQYMERAKENITTAGHRIIFVNTEIDAVEAVIDTLASAKKDIFMSLFQLGRMYEQHEDHENNSTRVCINGKFVNRNIGHNII